MSEDVWSEQATSPDAIEAALRELLRKRHAANRALAPARVLNLVVLVDHEWKDEVSNRLESVGRYHASRTILCSVHEGRQSLDAVAAIAYEAPANGGIHPVRERVDIDLGAEQLPRLDTVVDPILVSELPTMLWAPHGHSEAVDALLPLTDVILIDSDDHPTKRGLAHVARLREFAYVVDLAWMRTIPWRERLASSFDLPERRRALPTLTEVCVRHHPSSLATAALLVGWLASRLEWEQEPLRRRDDAGWLGKAWGGDERHEIGISLVAVDQEAPGLAGVTVGWDGGWSLSLDRAAGGLCARQRDADGQEQTWQVLGASRGEGGILGEGVRQALLRDPTYGPALAQALVLRCEGTS
jgi:glucose-6-phosphate dehydrogenase assembly protein OpcA